MKALILGITTAIIFSSYFLNIIAKADSLAGPIEFFYSPKADAHQPIIDAIDQAKKSIKMVMFHLSDPTVGSALMFAAKRGVDVRIIFDKTEWRNPIDQKLVEDMKAAGVNAVLASKGFSITHEKAMVVDDSKAMISTMNQVRTFAKTLDFGIFTYDSSVIAEMNSVFEADWENAANNGNFTPNLTNPYLVWSPINSLGKIVNLIKSAKRSVSVFVENLGHVDVSNALMEVANRGVVVRVIVPMCDLVKLNLNYPYVQALRQAKIDARMLPGTGSPELPYVHAKAITVDQQMTFFGSENLSYNSLTAAREVGIIIPSAQLSQSVEGIFDNLWPKAQLPPADPNYKCGAVTSFFNNPSPYQSLRFLPFLQ